KLNLLSRWDIHSIEQPIKAGQFNEMAKLCSESPLAIALDEELIGVPLKEQAALLDSIKPQYIILKPSLIGGFASADHWIDLCEERNIDWWATSALESNLGLSAIAQWVASKNNLGYQGLGTGQLYSNNIKAPLLVERGELHYTSDPWDTNQLAKLLV
ncbi:MAG: enolase C-terminal domain-like protein, partial [Flavobacteriales bacterium]